MKLLQGTHLLFIRGGAIIPVSAKNTGKLQTSAVCLVEEHSRLEF